jgi:O-antigen/teichoic acid export membrane protein
MKTYLIPIITLLAGGVSVGLNIWAIPRWGIMGAAWVTVASYFVTFVMAEIVGRRALQLKYPWKKIFVVSILWVLVLITVKTFGLVVISPGFISLFVAGFGLLAFVISGVLVQDRKIVKNIFGKVLRVPVSRLGLLVEEERVVEDIGNRTF